MSRLARSSAGTSFYHNSTPFSKLFGEQTEALLAGRRDWGPDHLSRGPLGAQSFEDVSGETARTTSRAASQITVLRGCLRRNAQSQTNQKRELRGCLGRNGPDRLSRGISEVRFRGRLGRNGPDHLAHGISELRVWRMSQAKRAGPPLARHLRAQSLEDVSSETPNPGQLRNESCEDVSGETARTTNF